MRCLPPICTVFLCLTNLPAQQQETSLVDRLLRPNMELQNEAQGKKFAANPTIAERRAAVRTFHVRPSRTEKTFADEHDYSARNYAPRAFNIGRARIDTAQNRNADKSARIKSSGVWDVRSAPDTHGTVSTRSYAEDQRQFKEQGKSQKSLDRRNPPLTIDQVRELLNKNK